MRVADKFGDYGSSASASWKSWTRSLADRYVLASCRVLGRGVETVFLARIVEEARKAGASIVDASYLPTPKNGLASDFLAEHGFRAVGETAWTISADATIDTRRPDAAKAPQTELSQPT